MSLRSQLESILFVASKPLTLKKIAAVLNVSADEAEALLHEIQVRLSDPESGVVLLHNDDEWQMVSRAENREIAEQFLKAEITEELTRPQLETLTVISYCGPITKPELEQIRGVNCGVIIRNLLLRGLIRETDDALQLLPRYQVTMEYLRHLGLTSVEELPEYQELHAHEFVETVRALSNQESNA
jgi:segregation and condensation protein B